MIKVKAKFEGGGFGFIYNRRVYDGEVFEVKPEHFSDKWMVKIKKKPGPKPKKKGVRGGTRQLCESESGSNTVFTQE